MMLANRSNQGINSLGDIANKKQSSSRSSLEEMEHQEEGVETPGVDSYDVICGRCSLAFNHVGNRRFRVIIGMNVQKYIDAPTRPAKGVVIQQVVKIFLEELGTRFVRMDSSTGKFVQVSAKVVRQKVGHALRDLAVQKSSNDSEYTVDSAHSSPSPTPRKVVSLEAIRRSQSVSPVPRRPKTIKDLVKLLERTNSSSSSTESAQDQTTDFQQDNIEGSWQHHYIIEEEDNKLFHPVELTEDFDDSDILENVDGILEALSLSSTWLNPEGRIEETTFLQL